MRIWVIGVAKVLWLFEYPVPGGGEYSLLAAWPSLQAAGFRPVAAAPDGPVVPHLAQAGVPHLEFDLRPRGTLLSQTARRARLAQLLAEVEPDLVHANSLAMSRLLGPVSRAAGVPSIGHVRDIVGLSRQAMEDINQLDRVIAVSQETLDYHQHRGLNPQRSCVLHNGVDLVRFAPRPRSGWLLQRLNLSEDCILAGDLGQLIRRKGHDVMLCAAQRLLAQFPRLHWVIAGSCYSQKGEAERFHEQLHTTANACAGRVHLLGNVEPAERLLNELTLLVHPARQEPLGRVLLEAAACGLAIVATDVGGTRSIFPQSGEVERAAWLVPPDDPQAIASAVASLLTDAPQRQSLASAARLRAETAFSARMAGERLVAAYQQVAFRRES